MQKTLQIKRTKLKRAIQGISPNQCVLLKSKEDGLLKMRQQTSGPNVK